METRGKFFCAAALLLAMMITSCGNHDDSKIPNGIEWEKLGLDGKNVRELRKSGSSLFAATDEGLFKKNLLQNGEWVALGFEGEPVRSILIDDNTMYASVVAQEDPQLYMSPDGGETWAEVEDNFGGDFPEPIFHLTKEADVYYATGYAVVAKSTDDGASWTPIWNDWQAFATGTDFIEVNPHNGDLWAGGQNAIEQMVLIKSGDGGETWQQWSDLVEAPSVAKDILFHTHESAHVYVGFEGALLKTTNGGATWETLIASDENRFFFGISQHPDDPDKLYAAGWLKRFDDPQPLILFVSDDDGATWKTYEHPDEDFGGVNDMILAEEAGEVALYVGLWKGGVYRVVVQ